MMTLPSSCREDMPPGHFVILDSFIDRTHKRIQTYHTQVMVWAFKKNIEVYKSRSSFVFQELTTPRFGKVCHIPMHPSFCNETAACFYEAGKELGLSISPKGTAITIEGPRFSSRAESKLFQSWGADVINMTTVPEVVLAKELGMSYARYFMSCT